MKKELKARIPDLEGLELNLKRIGASFIREIVSEDTYYIQPEGYVLKIVRDDDGMHLSRLRRSEDGFEILVHQTLSSDSALPSELKKSMEFIEYSIRIGDSMIGARS